MKSENNKKSLDSDVVVIGAGGSGLSAAVAAAGRGVKEIVIDKQLTSGGTMNMLVGRSQFCHQFRV